jgi:hypothetical protein
LRTAVAAPIVIVLEIVVLVLVFVIKPNKQLKPLGIYLIVVSAIVLIGTGWYGILARIQNKNQKAGFNIQKTKEKHGKGL